MSTFDDVRRAALALPGALEVPWYENVTLQVGKKGFAYSFKGDALMRLGRDRVDFLVEVRPEVFRRFSMPGGHWATVDLAALQPDEVTALVREAWTGVAPAKLRKSLEKA